MSSKTPIESTVSYKGIDKKLQDISADLKAHLSWLSYGFGLADRIVETRNEKPYIYPAIYQNVNSQELISLMPSDLYDAFCFWVKEPEALFSDNNPARMYYKVSIIFYCDLKQIAPTDNYKLTKTKIRQDILEAFRIHLYGGYGIQEIKQLTEDDLAVIYKGFSIDQVDNKYKMYPKYSLKIDFDFAFLIECNNGFNSYS